MRNLGSVIQKVQEPRSQSSDRNSDDNEFGSCEDRVNVLLNGPLSGYDGTDNILRFGLESMYGVNYNSKFIVKSSKFATMSNVIDKIKAGTHEEKSEIGRGLHPFSPKPEIFAFRGFFAGSDWL